MIGFVKFNPSFVTEFHKWEVVMFPFSDLRVRIETFTEEEFETPEDQYGATIDLVNGCRFSDTKYKVFMDDMLTDL